MSPRVSVTRSPPPLPLPRRGTVACRCVLQSVVNTIRLYEAIPNTSWPPADTGIKYSATYDKVMSFLASNGM